MPLTLENDKVTNWTVRKIAVVGPGIVGMPMAAMLINRPEVKAIEYCMARRGLGCSFWPPT